MKVYSGNPNRVRKTAHRMPPKTTKKLPFKCNDGPMKGETLYLEADGATAIFSLGSYKGRYNKGRWEDASNNNA